MKHERPRIATPEEVAGRQLARLRDERGWSQAEVAERMEAYGYTWHQTTVGRIESGQRPLRFNEVIHVAALFGVSPIQFFVPNTTPARLKEDIRASEEGREFVASQLEEARADLEERSGVQERYQRLERELERADMHLAALRGLEEIIARQGAPDA